MGQMLGCIIADFYHCPASSCLGHQQTYPRVREDSSCSFHTTPSHRQRGKGERKLQPATSKQPASLRTWLRWPKKGESPKTPIYLSSLTAPFCTSHISGSLPVQPIGKKISNDFQQKKTPTVVNTQSFSPYK